ncbi:MAG: Crp/Fnr family transcriptional regulator, partial [Candidatus Saccharimonadales bacterium]
MLTNTGDDELSQLFQKGRSLLYERNEIVIRAGDTPSGIYYVVSGWIKVYSLSKTGEANIIMTLLPGEVFPVAWAVTGVLHEITFAALDATELRRISHEQFTHVLRSRPRVAHVILRTLGQHFFALASELDNLQYRSARERIVFRVIFLAGCFGRREEQQVTIPKRVPVEYIARSTNLTRETASRELRRLHHKKIISLEKGRITIPDITRLRNEISPQ